MGFRFGPLSATRGFRFPFAMRSPKRRPIQRVDALLMIRSEVAAFDEQLCTAEQGMRAIDRVAERALRDEGVLS